MLVAFAIFFFFFYFFRIWGKSSGPLEQIVQALKTVEVEKPYHLKR